jgi:predicted DNA-binding transcriptional regulator
VGIDLWSLKGIDKEYSKILALWLNSSINILQLLYMGVACEGPWMKLHDYMLDRLLVPNPGKLTKKEKEELLEIFSKHGKTPFISITEQLKNGDKNRKMIDKTWLKMIGYKGEPEQFLTELYNSISEEIRIINELMQQQKE